MRSGELARLAGVTVRTLRHYHAIGLLEEPARGANGYRDYTPQHLLRVLRIRQLASLGLPLDRVGEMLSELDAGRADGPAEGAPVIGTVLDELDAALADQIARLEEQRRVVARLRSGALEADFPERAAGALAAMQRLGERAGGAGFLLAIDSDADRLAMGIAAHLDDEAELAEIERVFNAIVDRDLVEEYRDVSELVEALPADARAEDIESAVAACLGLLEGVLDCFDPANWLRDDKDYELLLESTSRVGFNDAQLAVSDAVFERFGAMLAQGKPYGNDTSM